MAWRNSRDSTFMKHNSPNNRSAQPEPHDPTSIADSSNITRNIYMVSVCWLLFAQGWNDASTGPLLHVAQAFYRLNFTMISMLFVCSTVVSLHSNLSDSTLNVCSRAISLEL
ncbi:hypothetical protein FRC02_004986 [Tulasnella sp. 418]|nr:hypothetical protein FRC02_004986 [Tulasnella sp. 418]